MPIKISTGRILTILKETILKTYPGVVVSRVGPTSDYTVEGVKLFDVMTMHAESSTPVRLFFHCGSLSLDTIWHIANDLDLKCHRTLDITIS